MRVCGRFSVLLGAAAVVAGCSGSTSPRDQTVSLSITPQVAQACVGDSLALSAALAGVPINPTQVQWTSLNPSVATVSIGGVLEALQVGSAAVKATAESDEAATNSTVVTVVAVPAITVAIGQLTASGTGTSEEPDSLNGTVEIRIQVPSLLGCANRQFSQADLMLGPPGSPAAATVVAETGSGMLTPDSSITLSFNTQATSGAGAAYPNGAYAMFVKFVHAGSFGNNVQSSILNVTIRNPTG